MEEISDNEEQEIKQLQEKLMLLQSKKDNSVPLLKTKNTRAKANADGLKAESEVHPLEKGDTKKGGFTGTLVPITITQKPKRTISVPKSEAQMNQFKNLCSVNRKKNIDTKKQQKEVLKAKQVLEKYEPKKIVDKYEPKTKIIPLEDNSTDEEIIIVKKPIHKKKKPIRKTIIYESSTEDDSSDEEIHKPIIKRNSQPTKTTNYNNFFV